MHRSCVEFEISINGGWCPPLQRLNDQHIATAFTNLFPTSTRSELRLFRECFRHMHTTTLADLTNAAGTHLACGVRDLLGPVYKSNFHFHLQPLAISRNHRIIWREFLNSITTDTTDQLRTPLGGWTTPPSTHRPFRLARGSLFHQHSDEIWYRHQICDTQRTTRATYHQYSTTIFFQQDLPSHNTIVDVEIRGDKFYVSSVPLGDAVLPPHLHTGASPPRAQWIMRTHMNLSYPSAYLI